MFKERLRLPRYLGQLRILGRLQHPCNALGLSKYPDQFSPDYGPARNCMLLYGRSKLTNMVLTLLPINILKLTKY